MAVTGKPRAEVAEEALGGGRWARGVSDAANSSAVNQGSWAVTDGFCSLAPGLSVGRVETGGLGR